MSDDLIARLRNPPFGTETSERHLMASAADRIAALEAEVAKVDARRQNAEAAYNDGWSFAFRQWERTGSVPPPPQRAITPPGGPTPDPVAEATRIDALEEALIWCSAAFDSQEGGVARVGWLKLCKPLIAEIVALANKDLT